MLGVHQVSEVASIVKDHVEGLTVWPVEGLLDAPDILLVRLSLPGVHGHPCLGDGCGCVVLRGEDVARAPLHLWGQSRAYT